MSTEAELLANLPADGVRVWRLKDTRRYHATALDGSIYWSFNHDRKEWSGPFSGDGEGITIYTDVFHDWREVTPTLPDPSGDLPDGTRVRMVFEGEVKAWVNGNGNILTAKGNLYFGRADASHATIEVLSLPTPPPSALDGKPGSLWVDPETGTTWARRDMHNEASRFTQVQGKWLCGGSLCQEYDSPLITRLVPAQVADDE